MSKKHRLPKEAPLGGSEILKDESPKVYQRNKYKEEIPLRKINWTPNQQKIIDTILDKNTKIVFIAGSAGSGKSLLSTYCGLKLISDKKLSDYLYIRSPLESSSSAQMGFIPGDINDKFEPYIQIFKEKSEELSTPSSIRKLMDDSRVHFLPINYIRGSTMAVKYIQIEECNNICLDEFDLILTRYGEFSKMIFVGDFNQTDLPPKKQGAFKKVFDAFNDEENQEKGIFCFELQESDIKRAGITAHLIKKMKEIKGK